MIRSKGVQGRLGIGEKQELIQGRMLADIFFNQVCKSLSSNSKQFGFVSEEAALFPEEGKIPPLAHGVGLVLFDLGIPQQPKNVGPEECH